MKRILLAVLAVCLSMSIASAQKIHSIIFADTNDNKIGAGVTVNMQKMTNFIDEVATALDMEDNCEPTKLYYGNDCNKANLAKVINSFSCENKDIVVFCYLGHGGRSYKDSSDFPQMCLGSSYESQFVPLEDVYDALRKKGPRFCFVMGDCCNSYATGILPKRHLLCAATNSEVQSFASKAIKKMFLEFEGGVIASGCQKGEYSWVNSVAGGFFTNGLIETLDDYCSQNNNYNWTDYLQLVRKNVVDYSKATPDVGGRGYVQTPIFRVDRGAGGKPIVIVDDDNDNNNDNNNNDNKKGETLTIFKTSAVKACDESNNYEARKKYSETVLSCFMNSDVVVDIVGRDMKTVVDHMSAKEYVSHLRTAFRLSNISVVSSEKNSSGKFTRLVVHEIYKERKQ